MRGFLKDRNLQKYRLYKIQVVIMNQKNNQNVSVFKKFIPWLAMIIAIATDQITKIIIMNYNISQSIANGYDPFSKFSTWLSRNPVEIIGDWLKVILVYNDAAIFGMDFGLPDEYQQLVLIITTIVAVGIIILFYNWIRPDKVFPRVLLGLIIGGALGNLIDRVFGNIIYRGEWKLFFEPGVVDWIDAGIPQGVFGLEQRMGWFIFNMADSFITVSIILLLIYIIFTRDSDLFKHKDKNAKEGIKVESASQDIETNTVDKNYNNDENNNNTNDDNSID
jgi:signal peptidase II